MSNLIYLLLRRLRSPLITLILVYAISMTGYVMIPGEDGNHDPYQMSFFDAFYFVSFMGTTIGFGEIPYEFTQEQRYWTLVCLYATVISWLYGVGSLLNVFQDPAFRQQIKINSFKRSVSRIRQPFYLICGYGETGRMLVNDLAEDGILSVILDPEEGPINELEVNDLAISPLWLKADASDAQILEIAGINHRCCSGIISLANNDRVNLTIAIVAQLLNKNVRLIARADSQESESNILSFGANEVINPFETFASRLALAIHSPALHLIYEWTTGSRDKRVDEIYTPKNGKWIICGFGDFGRAAYRYLDEIGETLCVIEPDRNRRDLPSGTVIGRPTEAATLKKAGIDEAVGIIAGTGNDPDNLSVLMTAFEINQNIFRIAHQNEEKNQPIFEAANLDLVMRRGNLISDKIFALIRTPLLGDFLRIVSRFKKARANILASRMIGVMGNDFPELWELTVDKKTTPALFSRLEQSQVLVKDLLRHPDDRDQSIQAIMLFLKRGDGNVMLPEDNRIVHKGDRFLMCGNRQAHHNIQITTRNDQYLQYVLTGKLLPDSWVWKKIIAYKEQLEARKS
ncbi:potassium channel protein [Leucothrix arctica]|uniref:Potassium transporter TrkA n=1 Tax=Leucothrix arctica TaxID=1481894 RepID=A0A317CBX7_9GAMM|nr:potassium channel protein [Leucothrix arctica]PWQ93870.1 potassium transporter TrkA [Leucothrix arctica]